MSELSNGSQDPKHPEYWVNLFFAAHPGGGEESFAGWAAEQSTLREDEGLRLSVQEKVRTWLRAEELLAREAPELHGDSVFRRRSGEPRERKSIPGQERLEPGREIGQFVLRDFIAHGGMGQVWEAEDTRLRRRVALKLVLPNRVDERNLALFSREARAGGRLKHGNLVMTLAYGTDDGLTWIAQELIVGSWTLKDTLDSLRQENAVPAGYYGEVAQLVAAIADGMQAAHDVGVIHRDLKPQNILIADNDQPKVTDFGLARVSDDSFPSFTGDHPGGTWHYMSPEQVAHKRMGLDHRTDVFSLGVVLYELLSLTKPFDGDTTHQIATRIITEDPLPVTKVRSQCPPELGIVCAKAMEKAPDRRYPSMGEFAADLRRFLNKEPILAKPPSWSDRGSKWVRRHPGLFASVTVSSLSAVTIGFLALSLYRSGLRREELLIERGDALEKSDEERARATANLEEATRQRNLVLGLLSSRDKGRLDDLRESARELVPPLPFMIPQIKAWQQRIKELRTELVGVPDGYPGHRATLDEVRKLAESEEFSGEYQLTLSNWVSDLEDYIQGLERMLDPESGLTGTGVDEDGLCWPVGRRLEEARQLSSSFGEGGLFATRWQESLPVIRNAAPYRGLPGVDEMRMTAPLVPLSVDPSTGEWTFWHVLSGEEPALGSPSVRDAVTLTLKPGGALWKVIGDIKAPKGYVLPYFQSTRPISISQMTTVMPTLVNEDPLATAGVAWESASAFLDTMGLMAPSRQLEDLGEEFPEGSFLVGSSGWVWGMSFGRDTVSEGTFRGERGQFQVVPVLDAQNELGIASYELEGSFLEGADSLLIRTRMAGFEERDATITQQRAIAMLVLQHLLDCSVGRERSPGVPTEVPIEILRVGSSRSGYLSLRLLRAGESLRQLTGDDGSAREQIQELGLQLYSDVMARIRVAPLDGQPGLVEEWWNQGSSDSYHPVVGRYEPSSPSTNASMARTGAAADGRQKLAESLERFATEVRLAFSSAGFSLEAEYLKEEGFIRTFVESTLRSSKVLRFHAQDGATFALVGMEGNILARSLIESLPDLGDETIKATLFGLAAQIEQRPMLGELESLRAYDWSFGDVDVLVEHLRHRIVETPRDDE